MADKPVAEVVNVDAVIDALVSPNSSDVYEATLPFNPHAVAASAVRRAGEGGGGGSVPLVSGSGSPVESVTPTAGKPLYIDTTNGTLYLALGATDLDWVALGPVAGNVGEATGLVWNDRTAFLLAGDRDTPPGNDVAYFGDAWAQWNGNGQGLYWRGNSVPGDQELFVKTGASGEHVGVIQDKDGNMSVPVGLSVGGNPIQTGAWTAYTPTVVQGSGTIVANGTNTKGRYLQFGKMISATFNVELIAGTAGQAGQTITVSLPVQARALVGGVAHNLGFGSANVAALQTGALFARNDADTAVLDDATQISVGLTNTLAPGDYLLGNLLYEAV